MEVLKIIGVYIVGYIGLYISSLVAGALSSIFAGLLYIPIGWIFYGVKPNNLDKLKNSTNAKFFGVAISIPIAYIPILFLFAYFGSVVPILFFALDGIRKILIFVNPSSGIPDGQRWSANELLGLIITMIICLTTFPKIWFFGK